MDFNGITPESQRESSLGAEASPPAPVLPTIGYLRRGRERNPSAAINPREEVAGSGIATSRRLSINPKVSVGLSEIEGKGSQAPKKTLFPANVALGTSAIISPLMDHVTRVPIFAIST